MNELSKFLKVAKDILVNPGCNIENKIIDRIKNLNEDDKKVLDEGFMNFLKKSNSRLYFFNKKIKENSGLIILFAILGAVAGTLLFIEFRNYKKQKASLPSPENKGEDK